MNTTKLPRYFTAKNYRVQNTFNKAITAYPYMSVKYVW